MVRLGLFISILVASLSGQIASAQIVDDGWDSPPDPTDYGAGYKMAIVTQQQQHALGPGVDTGWGDAIKLDKTYPLISSPLTPEAKAFNAEIYKMLPEWWSAPADNTTQSDADTDITLDCEPAGENPPIDNGISTTSRMLPGVISIACMNYVYEHGAAHGGGVYWGFNWIVHQRRQVKADDIFAQNSGWLNALAAFANKDRQQTQPADWIKPLDFADSRHWVLNMDGLGFAYSQAEYSGFEEGGDGGVVDIIPWSKLRPYLNPHGIVPKADWNATLPTPAT